MKAILEFNLPEEKQELNDAISGAKLRDKVDTLYDSVFRPHIKHESPIVGEELTEDQYAVISAIWNKVLEHFSEE